MWRDDAYLLDMLLAVRKALQFTNGVSREQFLESDLLQNAVMRLIQIIGEAARHISPDFQKAHPDIPWHDMIGMRHRLVHEYFRIDATRVWEVIQQDLPTLIPLIEPLIPPDESKLPDA
ncbi:MAG: HepT-like ribonuclease domain-containing protein [Gammaproteobacteria bacterium]